VRILKDDIEIRSYLQWKYRESTVTEWRDTGSGGKPRKDDRKGNESQYWNGSKFHEGERIQNRLLSNRRSKERWKVFHDSHWIRK
jgi:hypothetical protein